MIRAVAFNMRYGSFAIPTGDAGTVATLNAMCNLACTDALSLPVRRVAADVVQGASRDAMEQAGLLGDWISRHVEFLADPLIVEALTPPSDLVTVAVTRGIAQGDCDDVAMLAAALGISIGLRARFVVVAFGADPSAPFAHVWAELGDVSGDRWLTIDPTRPIFGLPTLSRAAVFDVA